MASPVIVSLYECVVLHMATGTSAEGVKRKCSEFFRALLKTAYLYFINNHIT